MIQLERGAVGALRYLFVTFACVAVPAGAISGDIVRGAASGAVIAFSMALSIWLLMMLYDLCGVMLRTAWITVAAALGRLWRTVRG